MIIESGITIGSNITVGDLPTNPYQTGLYPFSTFTFTTGNVVGSTGANITQLFANSYSVSNASNVWLTSTSYFGMGKQGYQYWIVPQTAQYTIEVAGARSGIPTYTSNTNAAARYGRGAVVRATFTLEQGTNVTIAVGQPSANTTQPSTFSSTGGGGGSFVVLPGNFPLIVAGGGGAAGNWSSNVIVLFGGNGQTTSFGGNSFNGAPGGFNGWGGNSHVNLNGVASVNGYDSGGGGGFILPGVYGAGSNVRPGSTTTNNFGQGGWHFLANLVGGLSSTAYLPPQTSAGGFGGGGGAGPIVGGAGGGYSGGGGGYSNNGTAIDAAGGGGSWIAANATAVATSDGQYERSGTFGGSSITNLSTVNAGPGYVRITKI
jgi:hypothetical protein